ncbi:MAG: hypothetical protein JNJ73_17680 [Hyphomonadaceae bacterium]|nr:hypothetical protein [Hyphomonadaceae bacterium]
MSAITIRNIPEDVHDGLRKRAAERRQSVEAFVRDLLKDAAGPRRGGIDFAELERRKAELGIVGEGPEWTEEMDDPALSRRVLGLED